MSAPPPMIDRSDRPCLRPSRHPARRRALVAAGLLVFGGLAVATGGSIGLALIAVGGGEVVIIHNDSLRELVCERI